MQPERRGSVVDVALQGGRAEAGDVVSRAKILDRLRLGDTIFKNLTRGAAIVVLVILGGVIVALMSGKSYFSPAVARVMLDDYVRHLASRGIVDRYESLSEREREVFQLIAEGHTNKEIATRLSVSPATVDTHRAHIFQKLDVHNTAELVLYAVRKGVIT